MITVRKEREMQIIKKAIEDADFKKKLLSSNAKAAIAEEAGIMIPDDISVTVIEETAGKLIFVLPRDISGEVGLIGALSDDDLESVAGGKGSTTKTCKTKNSWECNNTHDQHEF